MTGAAVLRDLADRWSSWLVALLFVALGLQLTFSIREQSQTFDESFHLFSGYQYWRHGDFAANAEHPPLVKLAAAFPLLFQDLEPTKVLAGPTKVAHIQGGVEFLYRNTTPAAQILFASRMGASIFAYVLALLVLLAAREISGTAVSIAALTLLVFDPNILGNGALVTTDVAVTAFVFAAAYAYYRYGCRPTAGRLIACGVAVGLGLASKMTGLLLIPIMLLLVAGDVLLTGGLRPQLVRRASRAFAALSIVFVVALFVVWAIYTFRYAARPEGFELSPTLAKHANALRSEWQSRAILAAARFHLMPEAYLWGLADILAATEGRSTYLLGKVYATGQWFYFPAVFAMKSTVALLVLLAAAPFALVRSLRPSRNGAAISGRALWFLVAPPAVIVGASVTSGLSIGFRHILPIVPFLAILAAASAVTFARRSRTLAWVVTIVFAAHVLSVLRSYPNYLTYSNELAGGPSRAYRVMSDANVDWGQGMVQAAKYLSARGIRECWFAPMMPHVDPADLGIPCRTLQSSNRTGIAPPHPAVVDGILLLSAFELAGQAWGPGELNPYGFLTDRAPDALIANSILVYHGRFEIPVAAASNRARRARLFLSQGMASEALEEAREALAVAPALAESQGIMCQVLAGTGRRAEAEPYCRATIAIADRTYPEYQRLRIAEVRAAAGILRRRD